MNAKKTKRHLNHQFSDFGRFKRLNLSIDENGLDQNIE